MFAEDLWENAYAFETSLFLFAHLTQPIINWFVENIDGEIFQNLGSAVVREGIRVGAGVSGCEEHYSSIVVIGRHIRYVAIVRAMFSRRDIWVVPHYEAPAISVDGGRCTMAEPYQVPAVSIRRVRRLIFGRIKEGLAAKSNVFHGRSKIQIPIGIIFDNDGC